VVFFSTIKCFTLLVHLVCQICEIYCNNKWHVLFRWNLKAYINDLIPILKVAPLGYINSTVQIVRSYVLKCLYNGTYSYICGQCDDGL